MMIRSKNVAAGFLAICLVWGSLACADNFKFLVFLDGSQEVPAGSGDPNGVGRGTLFINSNTLTVDWNFKVRNIQVPISAMHIHQGNFGFNGPVVVDFHDELVGSGLHDPDLANVLANPSGFYVNIHNTEFPGGAIRGQIGAAIPEPTSGLVCGLVGALLLLGRRRKRW